MIKNTHYHLNKFIKGASGCNCPGDGVFFIKISSGVPTLTNISGTINSFPTSPFLKRFIKTLSITEDGIYGFRAYDGDVMFDDILTCPNMFVASEEAKEFVFNTNNCEDLDDGFFGIKVLGCNASYVKVFNYDDCGIDAPTGLTSNGYTCGDVILSWNDVTGASSYTITQGVNTYTSTISMVTIPYTTSGSKTFSVVANGVAGPSTATTITINMVQCAILGLTDNDYVHGDLTLSWEENLSATYYQVTYGATTTTVTDPEIVIPFTVGGSVTYQVSACDGSGCSVPSSITVIMMQSTVTGISDGSYTCGDMTITWDLVAGADIYSVSYGSPVVTTTSLTNSIVIPFTIPSTLTYTVQAGNINGFNTGGSASLTMESCGIGGLTYGAYECGDVTIDWDNVATATSYTVTYGITSTSVAVSTITIPYTTPGLVTYTIEAFNGATLLATATIDVTMASCSDFFGNLYVQQVGPTGLVGDGTLTIIGNNNPSNPILDTTYFDALGFGEVAGFSGTMNCDGVRQDPTTKKVFYWNSLGLYVGQPGKKTVTQLSSIAGWTQPVRDGGTIWYYNSSNGQLYKGTDTTIGILKATYTGYSGICPDRGGGIALWSPTLTPWVLDTNGGANYSIFGGNSEIAPVSIIPYTLTNGSTQPANIMFRSGQFYAGSSRVGGYGGNPISGLAAALTSTGCGTLSIRQMKAYGEYLYIIYDFNESEVDLTLSGSYYKPTTTTQAAIVKIRTARVTSLYDSWDYDILNTDLNTTKQTEYYTIATKKYYASRIVSFSVNTAPDGYIYIFGVGSYSEVSPTFDYGVGSGFALKIELDGTYDSERTQIPLGYNGTVCDGHNIHWAEAFRI